MKNKTYSFASFVMPALNEEKNIELAVQSVMDQELDIPFELIIAVGRSRDKTNRIAKRLEKENPGAIRVIKNPKNNTAKGLNLAISEAKGDVVIRVDAHSELTYGYASQAVNTLQRTQAANVGGMMHAIGTSPFQGAVAWAYGSRFGLGGGSFHVGGSEGEVDSVYLGVFDKQKLVEVGGFDEELIRGQDWELNLRLRRAGYKVWFDPKLEVRYYPRGSWISLAKQFYKTGRWRARLTRSALSASRPRYFIPPMLVFGSLFIFPALIYFISVVMISVFARIDGASRGWLIIVLPTMHYSWGLGFITGMLFKAQIRGIGS